MGVMRLRWWAWLALYFLIPLACAVWYLALSS
jgi:hypothetical protein